MSDLFISYSRKDTGTVRRLAEALEAHRRDAWVDLNDVRPAEDSMGAIYQAISASQTFVFVISPDSVESSHCGRELGHALKQNKRLIPVVCRDVEAEKVLPALRVLDWIFVRSVDDFDRAVQRRVSALDTDSTWIRIHTRLLVLAQTWQDRQNNRSLLLAVDDLQAVESAVAQSAGKQPQPTALQQTYVHASRRRTARTARIRLTAVSVGLATSLALAGLAFRQYLSAEARARIGIHRTDPVLDLKARRAQIRVCGQPVNPQQASLARSPAAGP